MHSTASQPRGIIWWFYSSYERNMVFQKYYRLFTYSFQCNASFTTGHRHKPH